MMKIGATTDGGCSQLGPTMDDRNGRRWQIQWMVDK
uniref:Uncharacterized protein n=1 Tax=Cucumis melo TaxID=3656 RepID=A0A9I9DIU4_CUCME